ncbi:MAG: phoR 1 [Planctomycetaceae bacterium]|nr:phoR 1 [Planctomycetaceae bacterium]
MRHLSIRWRLTLWNVGVLAIIILGLSVAVLVLVQRYLWSRFDAELAEELREVVEDVSPYSLKEPVSNVITRRYDLHTHTFALVRTADGQDLLRSRFFVNLDLPLPDTPESLRGTRYDDLLIPNLGHFRFITQAFRAANSQLMVAQIAAPTANLEREYRGAWWTLGTIGPIALLVACVGGSFLASRALAPIEMITQTAERISAEKLTERLNVDRSDDELGRLSTTLNRMFDRLQESINEMRRFTADAAHELRSPLTVIRTEAEVALRTPRSADAYRQVIETTLEEVSRLSDLVNQLLTLSRHDSGIQIADSEEVPLDALLQDVAEKLHILAEQKQISLSITDLPDVTVAGDDVLLSQVFYNLVNNAVHYTNPQGKITVRGDRIGDEVRVTVEDTGLGIAPEHLSRLFDRFYRVDDSRNRASGGTGLGLAICRSIVESHHGHITVESQVGRGSKFAVFLPVKRTKNET